MEQQYEWFALAGMKAVKRGKRNHVAFDSSKNERITFTQYPKADLQKRLVEARITVRVHTMIFDVEATRWLVMYLDKGL